MKRIVRILRIVVFGSIGAVVLWAALDGTGGASSRMLWNHTWQNSAGRETGGYVTGPDGPEKARERMRSGTPPQAQLKPGVLLLHDRMGLSKEMLILADALAADGYVVLVPDAFHGRLAVTGVGAAFLRRITSDRSIEMTANDAFGELQMIPHVDNARIGVVGFGLGAETATVLAAGTAGIQALVLADGKNPVTDPAAMGFLGQNGPVLAMYAGKDRSIDADAVASFERILINRSIVHTIRVFEGEKRAFLQPQAIRAGGAAAEAWLLMRQFLHEALTQR